MGKFTEVYDKARNVLQSQEFSAEWQKFLTKKCDVKSLMSSSGFSSSRRKDLDRIREKIKKDSSPSKNSGAVIYEASENAKSSGSVVDRAVSLKVLKHVYRLTKIGSQDVWVYSPPKEYATWIFDEVTGLGATVKSKLAKDDEIFSKDDMKWMRSALAVAKKICGATNSKLANPGKKTKSFITRWFLTEDSTDDDMKDAINKLAAGFKKITAACKSSTLVFTDYADWRAVRDKYFGAAFSGGEGGGFPVIYLEGAFTRMTGNSGKQWLCAQTIIHEFSHHEVSTKDHQYDHQGLKPSASFSYAKTIENADSWGYFALDLTGNLSKADRDNCWK